MYPNYQLFQTSLRKIMFKKIFIGISIYNSVLKYAKLGVLSDFPDLSPFISFYICKHDTRQAGMAYIVRNKWPRMHE